MFEALFKVKEVGAMFVGRVGNYLDLLRIETEIQLHQVKLQLIGLLVLVLSSLFALFFAFLALLITFWDTPYRLAVAWGIVVVYVVIAAIGYATQHGKVPPEPAFASLRKELEDDIALAKEIL